MSLTEREDFKVLTLLLIKMFLIYFNFTLLPAKIPEKLPNSISRGNTLESICK